MSQRVDPLPIWDAKYTKLDYQCFDNIQILWTGENSYKELLLFHIASSMFNLCLWVSLSQHTYNKTNTCLQLSPPPFLPELFHPSLVSLYFLGKGFA